MKTRSQSEVTGDNGGGFPPPDPHRFEVSKGTLRLDRFMNRFIALGGIAVICAVFGILVFIFLEIVPLFRSASVEPLESFETGVPEPLAVGADEWSELPFILGATGDLTFVDTHTGNLRVKDAGLPSGFTVRSWAYDQRAQELILASDDARFCTITIRYEPRFDADGSRTIEAVVERSKIASLAQSSGPIEAVDFYTGRDVKSIALLAREADGEARLIVNTLRRKRTLFGSGEFTPDASEDLTALLPGEPVELLVGARAESLIVRLADERVARLVRDPAGWQSSVLFRPFAEGERIASMDFLQGKGSLNFTSERGHNIIYSLTQLPDAGLQFLQTRELPPLGEGAGQFAASPRNKAFLLSNGSEISLRFATTERVRWQSTLETPLVGLVLSEKYDRILQLDAGGTLTLLRLHDPHPEAGLKAYFGKVWYEGQPAPDFTWQSTGGSDDFEPKLSLIPLIVGSLKGTFYALLVAIPVALLAAIYTSQYLRPSLKRVLKPTMEIMASLPSVVLGFLGALWLAPILEDRVPSLMLAVLAIPTTAVVVGLLWNRLPPNLRQWIPSGTEFVVFVPLLLLVGYVGWQLGPAFERAFFTVTHPQTGAISADFRLWWTERSGSGFQQRNSLVVGIMMGFAVIPIIFTIAEDALSNVPRSLTSASLALGASRWQTTRDVVLPTASAGIFSALMIGLGRAVGETMIVVMATGNTPIMDFDIFTGMRTLSANIVVELPEAPHGGTLYRTLFLGAFLLFALTFVINTGAEIMRHRLHNRYKVIG